MAIGFAIGFTLSVFVYPHASLLSWKRIVALLVALGGMLTGLIGETVRLYWLGYFSTRKRSTFPAATPHFADDHAVVELTFAGRNTSFQHIGVDFEHRQFLADRGSLFEHEAAVF
jgi:hypothetical protein